MVLDDSAPEDISELTIEETTNNSSRIYTNEDLVKFFKTYHQKPKVTEFKTTIGLVGYPNVGKSSTINSILTVKKVAVSATPGKTKHFQTFNLDEDLILCDCPGLVMPSFVATKSDMIINGILPIDQMRDHVPPVTVVASLIPRHIFEDKYGLILRKPSEGEDPDRPPTSEELLNAFGFNRGFMTQNGQPDNARSARYILKDFVCGKLLYCYAPPGVEQSIYHTFPERMKIRNAEHADHRYVRAMKPNSTTVEDLDKAFFRRNQIGVHVKGVQKILTSSVMSDAEAQAMVENHSGAKPWKQYNKHKNKNKTKKIKRAYPE